MVEAWETQGGVRPSASWQAVTGVNTGAAVLPEYLVLVDSKGLARFPVLGLLVYYAPSRDPNLGDGTGVVLFGV